MEMVVEEPVLHERASYIVCSLCHQLLPNSEYYSDGNWCKMCQNLNHHHLTRNDYERMLELQHGCCAICGTDAPGTRVNRFVVDHNHECCNSSTYSCGKCVRGLLCANCNLMLGYAHDSVETLSKAMKYLT